jgi:hypothetical protein
MFSSSSCLEIIDSLLLLDLQLGNIVAVVNKALSGGNLGSTNLNVDLNLEI